MDNQQSSKSTVLIGVSGGSSAGKTTVVNSLLAILDNSIGLFQDNYYYHESTGINMASMHEELNKLLRNETKYRYIIIDGFLLYEDEKLFKMLDRRYFLEVDKETCRERRHGRVYDGQTDPEHYFDRHVWTNFLKYKHFCQTNFNKTDIVYMDGTKPTSNLVEHILRDF